MRLAAAACALFLPLAARGDSCAATLAALCGEKVKVSVAACKTCIVDNIVALAGANCSAIDETDFCDLAPTR
eukprot:gene5204-6663_t